MGQRRQFNTPVWNRTNITTCTDNYGSAPSGFEESTRVVWGSADAYVSQSFAVSAGTYTISCEIVRNSGSDQSCRLGMLSGTPDYASVTATATPQTFTKTVTHVSGSLQIGVRSVDSATPADILIRDIRVHAGAADLGADTLVGHLILGRGGTSLAPTVASGYMAFTGSEYSLAQFATSPVDAGMTMMVVGRRNASGTGVKTAIAAGPTYTTASLLFENNGADAYFGGTNVVNNGSSRPTGFWEFISQGWSVFGARHDGTEGDYWLDDARLFYRTISKSAQSAKDFYAGCLVQTGTSYVGTNYDIAAIAMWDRALTDEEYAQAYSDLLDEVSASSISNTARRFFISEGDSITALVSPNSYANLFAANDSPKNWGFNNAVNGSSLTSLESRKAQLLASIPATVGSRKFIISVLIGRNDFTAGLSTSTFLTNLASYLDDLRAAGAYMVLCTVLPATAVGFNTWRNTVNATLTTWVGTHCDVICDFAADGTMGPDAAASDTLLYSDGTHPTSTGMANLEVIYRAVINAI